MKMDDVAMKTIQLGVFEVNSAGQRKIGKLPFIKEIYYGCVSDYNNSIEMSVF